MGTGSRQAKCVKRNESASAIRLKRNALLLTQQSASGTGPVHFVEHVSNYAASQDRRNIDGNGLTPDECGKHDFRGIVKTDRIKRRIVRIVPLKNIGQSLPIAMISAGRH
jgi:hypothetical protein